MAARKKHGRPAGKKKTPAKAVNPNLSRESEGWLDRIERIHRRPGVRADQSDFDRPLRFRDSDDLDTVADVMGRASRPQHP